MAEITTRYAIGVSTTEELSEEARQELGRIVERMLCQAEDYLKHSGTSSQVAGLDHIRLVAEKVDETPPTSPTDPPQAPAPVWVCPNCGEQVQTLWVHGLDVSEYQVGGLGARDFACEHCRVIWPAAEVLEEAPCVHERVVLTITSVPVYVDIEGGVATRVRVDDDSMPYTYSEEAYCRDCESSVYGEPVARAIQQAEETESWPGWEFGS